MNWKGLNARGADKYVDGCLPHQNEGCDLYRMSELRTAFLRIDFTIAAYANGLVQKEQWGYPSNELSDEDFQKLIAYRDAIKGHYESMRLDYHSCLNAKELRAIVEKANHLVRLVPCGKELDNQVIDVSEFDATSKCLAYEPWEKALYLKMPELEVEVIKNECLRFAFDVAVTVNKDKACELFYDVSVEREKACDLTYNVKVDLEECRLNYEVLVNENKCDLQYDTYVELVQCGLTYNTIVELVECGVSPHYDSETGQIVFETAQGSLYNLTDLDSLDKIKL